MLGASGQLIDQAEGLRQLFALPGARTIAFVSGASGAGRTNAVINLAVALASAGRRVLVIDENYGPDNVAGRFGLRSRLELQHVVRGDHGIDEVLLRGPENVLVLPAPNAARSLARLSLHETQRAVDCFARLDQRTDLVLIDCVAGAATALSRAADEAVVVLAPDRDSITGTYAVLKAACRGGTRRSFRVIVNRTHGEQAAARAYLNLAEVAGNHLGVSLDSLGDVPYDRAIREAGRDCRAVVEATPTAVVAARFREIAARILQWRRAPGDAARLDSYMHKVLHTGRCEPAATRI